MARNKEEFSDPIGGSRHFFCRSLSEGPGRLPQGFLLVTKGTRTLEPDTPGFFLGAWYQMTCPGTQNAVSVSGMKLPNLAYIGGSVIVAIMALAVFVGGANACHHSAESAEQTSAELPQTAGEKAEVEA